MGWMETHFPTRTGWRGASRKSRGEPGRGSLWRRGSKLKSAIVNRISDFNLPKRALWAQKKNEEQDLLFRDIEEIKEFARSKMFGK